MIRDFQKWTLSADAPDADLPNAILTARPAVSSDRMPPEVALLLPGRGGAQDLMDALGPVCGASECIGLFLADPNLALPRVARQLLRLGITWVCNLPSVSQHEHDFRRYLHEVDLDHAREMTGLAQLGAYGLNTIATVSTPDDMPAALNATPKAVFVLPPVVAFQKGFPSLLRRVALEQQIKGKAGDVPVIGLREKDELLSGLSAAVLRPEAVSP